MAVFLMQVDWTNSSKKPLSFTDVEMISIKRDSEAKASYATIKLKNPLERFITGFSSPISKYVSKSNKLRFNEGDTIKIYAALITEVRNLDISTTSTDLLMTGEISEVTVKGKDNGCKILLKIVDKTWAMLNQLWSYSYDSTENKTAPQIVQDVIRQVTDETNQDEEAYDSNGSRMNGARGGYLIDARLESDGGYIEDTRQDDSAFPVTTTAKVFKPAYEFINDMSTIEHTNDFPTEDEDNPPQDRKMIFYVDELNRFHWFYPTDTVANDMSFIDGDPSTGNIVRKFDLKKKTFDIINLVFFNAGDDLNGSGITYYYYNKNTEEKQLKPVYKPWTDVAKNLIFEEIQAANLTKDNTQAQFVYEGNFYKETTGDYDGGGGITTTWGTVVTSDATYNTAVRTQAILEATGKAQALTEKRGSPRWKGSIDCGFKKYTAGDLLQFTSTLAGINEQLLRIKSVQYMITHNNFNVRLNVEEDEKKRGE